jgi:hypothetical protein
LDVDNLAKAAVPESNPAGAEAPRGRSANVVGF